MADLPETFRAPPLPAAAARASRHIVRVRFGLDGRDETVLRLDASGFWVERAAPDSCPDARRVTLLLSPWLTVTLEVRPDPSSWTAAADAGIQAFAFAGGDPELRQLVRQWLADDAR